MRNRQVAIDFKAKGIDDIIRELDKLQKQASDVKLAQGLESQFASLAEQANSLKDALKELKTTFAEEPKNRDNKELSSMEKKLKEVKEAVSKLTHDLATENAKIDATMAKMETAVDKLNSGKTFDGLLSQIRLVQTGFESLINQVKDYRELLSAPINIEPQAVAKQGKKVQSERSMIEKEIKELQALRAEDSSIATEAQNMNAKELSNLLSGMNDKVKELHREYKEATKDRKNQINREIYAVLKQVDSLSGVDDEDFTDTIGHLIADKFKSLKSTRTVKGNTYAEFRYLDDLLKTQLNELESQLQTAQVSLDDESKSEVTSEVVSFIKTITDMTTKKQKVIIHIGVADNEITKVEEDLNTVIETINASNPHIDVKLNFVSGPTVKNRGFLLDQLQDEIKKLDDKKVSKSLKNLIPKIEKQLRGDLYLEIGSNIENLKKAVPGALAVMKKDIEKTPINANIKVDQKDIQKQINKLGTITLPIGAIEIKKDVINHTDVEKTLEEVQQEFAEAQQGIQKEAKQSNPAEEYAESVARFVKDVQKIPGILNGLKQSIGVIDIEGKLIVDPKQIQDAIQTALNQLEDLHVKISRIDMNQPTIDKLKLDVKSDTLNLIQVEKLMITEMRALSNNLFPVLRSMSGEQPSGQPKNSYDIAIKALKDLSNFIDRVSKQYGLVDDTTKQVEKTSKEKFQEYVNNRKQKQEEQSKNTQPEEPINVIKTDVSAIASDVKSIGSDVAKIASQTDKDAQPSDELAKAIKGWVEASNVMSKIKDEDLAKTTQNSQGKDVPYIDTSLDRERSAVGDIKTGRISNPYIWGNKEFTPSSIQNAIDKLVDLTKYTLDIHSHPDDLVAPSTDEGDLGYYLQKNTKQALIVGRKQSLFLDFDMLSAKQKNRLSNTYTNLFNDKTFNANNLERAQSKFLDTFTSLSKSSVGKKYQDLIIKNLADDINTMFDDMGFGKNVPKMSSNFINDRIQKEGLNYLVGSQASLESFIKQLLGGSAYKGLEKEFVNSLAYNISSKSQYGIDALKFLGVDTKFSGGDVDISRYTDIAMGQVALEEAFKKIFPKGDFGKFARYLNYENSSELTTSAINTLLGIQNSESTFLEDIVSLLRQILNSLNNGNIEQYSPVGVSSVGLDSNIEKHAVRGTNTSSTPSWYTGWNKDNTQKRMTYDARLNADFEKYKKSVAQGDMSDLEYLQQFYGEYLKYASDDVANASKKEKKNKRNFEKYVKEQEKLNKQRLELEKQKNSLADKEDDAQRQAEQLMREREQKQNELAQRYANQQALEYSQAQKKADEEASKAKAQGRKQAESEYISNKTRQTTFVSKLTQMETLAKDSNLDGNARARVEDMVNRLTGLKDAAQITKKEFADIKKECAEINREAKLNIDNNRVINAQIEEQKKLHQQQLDTQKKEQQTQTKRSNQINQMVAQLRTVRGQQGVSSLTNQELDDLLHKMRLIQQQGNITEDAVKGLNSEFKKLTKQANTDITSAKRQGEQQVRQAESENKARMRSIASMSSSVKNLLKDKDFTQSKQGPAQGLLNELKQISAQGNITEDAFNDVKNRFEQINEQAKETIANQKQINDLVAKLNKLQKETNVEGKNTYTADYLNRVNEMIHRLESGQATYDEGNELLNASSSGVNMVASSKTLNNYIIKGQKLIQQNYMPGDLRRQFEEVTDAMQRFANEGGHSRAEVNSMINAFQKLEIEAAKAGKSLGGQILQRLQDMNAKFIATYFSFMDIIRYMRSMISTITELDTALTEMRKVSDESLASLKEYQKTTFDTAGALGTTAVQLQQSTADWLRLGESMKEASKSAVAATTLFNVSEFENVNEATTALVAMSQAYKDLDKTEIIDVMNNIGNNYSIATDQLATALQASASSLMVQGNDLYEAAALVTAGNAVIQDANKVGAGLRTISLRIAGVKEGDDDIKEELEELGEEVDEWVVSTQAKKRQVILDYTKTATNGGQGVDILDSNGNLRDTYHILLDIAKVYKDIQEEDKKYGTNRAKGLVEELAGKNRSNIAASILMNPELLENVYESALSSAGSAAEENAKYLDSIVGKTQQFKNELQELESNVLDGEVIKDVLDFGTTFLSVLNQIGDKLPVVIGLIGSLALGIGSVKKMGTGNLFMDTEQNKLVYKNQDVFKNIREKGVVGGIFSSLTGAGGGIDTQGIGATERGFNLLAKGVDFSNEQLEIFYNRLEEVGNAEVNFDSVLESMVNLDEETVQMAQDLKEQGVYSLDELQIAEQETGAAAQVAAVGVEIFSMAVRALAAAAVMAAFSLLVKLIKDAANASEDATREMKEFVDAVQQTRKELKDQKDFINEVGEEYDQLSKGVDDLGNNISLSADEFERYKTISNEIGDRFPEMIQGWTDQKDAIIATKDAVKAINDEYEKEARRKWAKYIDEGDLEKLSKSWYQINHANPFEQITTVFTGSTKAGVYDTYDRLEELYSTFLDMSYEEFKNFWNNGEYGSFAITDNQKILSKYSGNMNLLGFENLTEVTEENFQQARIKANAGLDAIRSDLDEQLNGWREAGQGLLDYNLLINDKEINKENREAISSIINNIDKDFIDSIDGDSDAFMSYVSDLIDIFENVNSDALSGIFQSVDTEKNYNQVVEDFDKAWSRVDEEFQRKIAESTTEAEKQKYREARNALFQASGGADLYEYQNRFDEYLRSLSQSEKEYEYLKGVTKDFSQTQMEAWYKETDAIYSATENVRRYEESLKKVEKQKYKDISALLSQNTLVDRDGFDERYDALQREYDRELELAKKAGTELDRTVYGNVDLNDRGVIEWDEENLKKYKNAIESWGGAIEDYADSLSTVDAMSEEFDGVEIAFTPMLQTPNGPDYLDSETVHDYINSLIAQMPEGWTNEDLLKLDAKGLEVNGKQIKGLIAEIGDEAIRVGETMHYLGEDGSLNTLRKKMDDVKSSAMSWNDIRDDLVGLAQAGKLDETTLKEYEYFDLILKELGLTADEAEEHISDMVNAINRMAVNNPVDDLANYRTEMDKLGDAYSKYKNGEFIDANTLSALQDAFGDLDSYQEFEKAVLTGDENLQEHFDNIVSEYAQVHQVLGNLTDDEKEYYKQMLIRSGISKESAEKAVEEASQHNKAIRGRIQLAIEDANTTAVQEQQLKKLVLSTDELDKATLKEVNDLITATGITGEAAEMIKYYAIQKDLAKHKDMRNDDDINYLLQVAEMAGIASASITALKHLSDQSADFQKDIADANTALEKYQGKSYINPAEQQEINRLIAKRDTAQSALDNMGKYADQAFDEVWNGFQDKFEQYQYTPNLDYGGVVSDASDAGSAAGESFKEALDKILAMYDAELDAGVVSFQTYVDKSRAIIQQYYNDGKIKASEYYDYLASLYEKQVSEYDKVISAVQRKLKEQTDELEKQKEAIEESYNTQIEEIQAKIDALQDENDEIEKNIALQKAQ